MSNEELVAMIQSGINESDNMAMLYSQNRGFIAKVVKRYGYACQSSYTGISIIEFDDLMNEAYFGLIECVKRYDPNQGVLFLSYASHWINQAMKRFLDNSGRVIRVPVHTQEKVYKYNQVTAHFINKYNRKATTQEYAMWLEVSVNVIEKLEKFMYQGATRSLDETLPGSENITFAEATASDVNIEHDVVEKVAKEQIKEELWDIVAQVLKDKKKIQIFKWRYINELTLEQTGEKANVSRSAIDQTIKYGIKMLRRNSRTRNLGKELGLWDPEIPFNASRVKMWAASGNIKFLDKRELKYAMHMGWIQDVQFDEIRRTL